MHHLSLRLSQISELLLLLLLRLSSLRLLSRDFPPSQQTLTRAQPSCQGLLITRTKPKILLLLGNNLKTALFGPTYSVNLHDINNVFNREDE
jgi:hypothetical protein